MNDQELHSALESMSDGLVLHDQTGKIIAWNRSAETILGLTGDQLLGRSPMDPNWQWVLEDGSAVPVDLYPAMACLRTGEPQKGIILGFRRQTPEVGWIRVNANPICEAGSDRPHRVVSTFLDVTAEIEAQRLLEVTRRNLEVAAELGGFYCWHLDYLTQTFWTNAEARELLGYPVDYQIAAYRFWQLIHPDDVAAMREALTAHGQSADPLRIEHRMNRKDGETAWVRTVIIFQRDEEGGLRSALGVVQDISERKANEDRLLSARDTADAANQAKSDFIANISHEIRTPMNGVIGIAGALAKTELGEKQGEMVNLILDSASSLQRLLSDILDLSKIEAGHLGIEAGRFDLREEVMAATQLSQIAAKEKGLTFEALFKPEAAGLFEGDAGRINQVVRNLLSNAVKFTTTGKVSLRVAIEPAPAPDGKLWVKIDVEDTGMGFGPENAVNLFKRFSQADNSITRRFGGSGLGLYLSRQIVEAMGGTIAARSTPRLGSIFTVRIPLRKLSEKAEPGPLLQAPPEPHRDAAVHGHEAERIRILLAEDHPTNQKVVQLILAPFPVDLTLTADGAQAVEAFREQAFDLVLMDMQMPVMDGLAAIRLIRAIETEQGRPRVPIAVLSANAMEHHREDSKGAGADLHIAKPVTPDRLLGAIDALLNP